MGNIIKIELDKKMFDINQIIDFVVFKLFYSGYDCLIKKIDKIPILSINNQDYNLILNDMNNKGVYNVLLKKI